MFNIKKLLTSGLVTIISISVMSISAFAKVEMPLKNGATLIMYEEGDIIPELPSSRSIPMVFNKTFPRYPSYNFVHGNDGDEEIYLGYNNTIRITFNASQSALYMNVFDCNQNDFITIGETNGLHYMQNVSRVYDITGLDYYGTYKIGFAGNQSSKTLSGTITVLNQ